MRIPDISAQQLAQLIDVSADLALILDGDGFVLDISMSRPDWALLDVRQWVGLPWLQTVSIDSQPKVAEMLNPANRGGELRWRHINHIPQKGEQDVPIQYVALPLSEQGLVLVLGRDLSLVAGLQQRLMDAQQSMERDYLRLRHMESRYHILFETASDPVLVVDLATRRVMEANPAAQLCVGEAGKRLVGRDIQDCFQPEQRELVLATLRAAQSSGRSETVQARFLSMPHGSQMAASVFRQEGGAQFLIRMLRSDAQPVGEVLPSPSWMSEAMERSPLGVVVTDRDGLVLSANAEFVSLRGATTLGQLLGQSMEPWLIRGSVDWGVLQTNLRQVAQVRGFATEMATLSGTTVQVEITAVTLTSATPVFALFVRDVGRQRLAASQESSGMAGSVAQLAQLVGRMPMKDIVGETSDMIERMCIQAALNLTHNNRASAAEMLGLSRQSLYVKLRRYDMAGAIAEGEMDAAG